MTFQDARRKLVAYVRDQVRNGEFTERGFARMIGISQPHAHNVLKGVRNLSPEIFDQALKNLNLSLLDLAPLDEVEARLQQRAHERVVEVPFHEQPIGPREPWSPVVSNTFQVPFPSAVVPAELAMVRLAADPAMPTTLGSYDIALLDTSTRCRSSISPQALYVVERNGEAVLRYIRPGAQHSYLVTDIDLNHPAAWEPLPLSTSQMHSVVKARVLWLGHERERHTPVQRGRFLDDPISW